MRDARWWTVGVLATWSATALLLAAQQRVALLVLSALLAGVAGAGLVALGRARAGA